MGNHLGLSIGKGVKTPEVGVGGWGVGDGVGGLGQLNPGLLLYQCHLGVTCQTGTDSDHHTFDQSILPAPSPVPNLSVVGVLNSSELTKTLVYYLVNYEFHCIYFLASPHGYL